MVEPIDRAGLLLFRHVGSFGPLGPSWLPETARDLTALGSNGVLGLLVGVLAARGWLLRRMRDALFLLGTFGAGLLLVGVAKLVVQRARPDIIEPAAQVFTTSFPSSHATMSAAIATAAVLLSRAASGKAERLLAATAAVLVCAAVGASRVYLGVHWPSDVVAGWLLGSSTALLCRAVMAR